MSFPDDVIKQAWERASGQCECNSREHTHFRTPCYKPLVWKNRGHSGQGGWEAHHINEFGGDGLFNCEILCSSCYERVS